MSKLIAVDARGHWIGEDHPKAKLTDREVELIRSLREEGWTYQAISDKLETPRSTVQMICQYTRRAVTVARWKVILAELPISLSEDHDD
ncbi:MAG TPA: hypothetical protein DEQ40_05785 [Oxalobacteraceae bacterium]|nr:hypothetical protein [Oxalobacteraceae bacterium]